MNASSKLRFEEEMQRLLIAKNTLSEVLKELNIEIIDPLYATNKLLITRKIN